MTPPFESAAKSINARRNRALRVILTAKDRALPGDSGDELRRVVLDEVNELADLCIEMVEAASGSHANELYRQVIDELQGIRAAVHPDEPSGGSQPVNP